MLRRIRVQQEDEDGDEYEDEVASTITNDDNQHSLNGSTNEESQEWLDDGFLRRGL